MKIGELMRQNIPIAKLNTTLEEAVYMLADSDISGIPVVDEEGKLAGIVTEHDVIKLVLPSYEIVKPDESSKMDYDFLMAARADQVRNKPVSSFMTKDVIAVAEDYPLISATSIMLIKKLKVIPVVRDGAPVGMVTRIDLAQAILRLKVD
ncbi:MAG: CBS domain-containing protein [Armatimonadota bacterium]|nr:CBS domain-containing protein [Armatimonadota bacterium]